MKGSTVAPRLLLGATVVIGLAFPEITAAQQCPAELAQATSKIAALQAVTTQTAQATDVYKPRGMDLKPATEAPRALAGARQELQAPRGQDIQAPRGQDVQAPRGQDVQAPRAQDIQAPRGQDIQAPRAQDIQAPRSQDIQAPRAQEIQAPRAAEGSRVEGTAQTKLDRSRDLVEEAERACKAGDMTLSTEKAKAALDVLN